MILLGHLLKGELTVKIREAKKRRRSSAADPRLLLLHLPATAFNHVWCVARLRDVGALASFTSSGVARNTATAFNHVWCVARLRDVGALASFTSSGVARRLHRMKDFVRTP